MYQYGRLSLSLELGTAQEDNPPGNGDSNICPVMLLVMRVGSQTALSRSGYVCSRHETRLSSTLQSSCSRIRSLVVCSRVHKGLPTTATRPSKAWSRGCKPAGRLSLPLHSTKMSSMGGFRHEGLCHAGYAIVPI